MYPPLCCSSMRIGKLDKKGMNFFPFPHRREDICDENMPCLVCPLGKWSSPIYLKVVEIGPKRGQQFSATPPRLVAILSMQSAGVYTLVRHYCLKFEILSLFDMLSSRCAMTFTNSDIVCHYFNPSSPLNKNLKSKLPTLQTFEIQTVNKYDNFFCRNSSEI